LGPLKDPSWATNGVPTSKKGGKYPGNTRVLKALNKRIRVLEKWKVITWENNCHQSQKGPNKNLIRGLGTLNALVKVWK